jgi:tetratricopeptide (TPR) repeat protein
MKELHYFLGYAYDQVKSYEESIKSYQQAIRIDPAYTEAYFQLGVTYLHSGDLESAKEEYNTLQNLDQELADKLYELINQ